MQRFLFLFICGALALISSASFADSAVTDEEASRKAERISTRIMSPFCPGRTIASCPSPLAGEWRDQIRAWSKEGLSSEEITRRLQEKAPDFNLSGAPESSLGPWLPLLLGLGAVSVLFLVIRAKTGKQASAPTEPAKTEQPLAQATQPALDARIDEELEELE